jgi:Tfp pilus assembly protein PilW
MRPTVSRPVRSDYSCAGMTLVELTITVVILAAVFLIVSSVFLSTSRFQSRTVRRAEMQMSSSQGMQLMTMEIRQCGADPAEPQIGVVPIVTGTATEIRVRSDLDGNGVLTTSPEPSEDVTYTYDAGQRAITRNPGSGAVIAIPNVSAMTLTYFDATNAPLTTLPLSTADAALVRSVGLTMTTTDRDSIDMTLATRIMLRNL